MEVSHLQEVYKLLSTNLPLPVSVNEGFGAEPCLDAIYGQCHTTLLKSWEVVTEAVGPARLPMATIWPFTRKFCWPRPTK